MRFLPFIPLRTNFGSLTIVPLARKYTLNLDWISRLQNTQPAATLTHAEGQLKFHPGPRTDSVLHFVLETVLQKWNSPSSLVNVRVFRGDSYPLCQYALPSVPLLSCLLRESIPLICTEYLDYKIHSRRQHSRGNHAEGQRILHPGASDGLCTPRRHPRSRTQNG